MVLNFDSFVLMRSSNVLIVFVIRCCSLTTRIISVDFLSVSRMVFFNSCWLELLGAFISWTRDVRSRWSDIRSLRSWLMDVSSSDFNFRCREVSSRCSSTTRVEFSETKVLPTRNNRNQNYTSKNNTNIKNYLQKFCFHPQLSERVSSFRSTAAENYLVACRYVWWRLNVRLMLNVLFYARFLTHWV